MRRQRFEELALRALARLPSEFQRRLENVVIVVEDRPSSRQRSRARLRAGSELLGLYEGVPQHERGAGYNLVVPDQITLFREPIEALCRSEEEIEAEVEKVVRHEIAHHFGLSERQLRKIRR
jgi:predicted Zn-dependent protease with MMP-like domain